MILIILGSNTGERPAVLQKALELISREAGEVILRSSVYETVPWGFETKDLFLNQVVEIDSELQATELMSCLLKIETSMGRVRNHQGYQSRIIDLDILFYNDLVLSLPDLVLPHPRLHLRRFVLEPLNEIVPGLIHPVFRKSIQQLLNECKDPLAVEKIN
jgi:2-amino-4-hydroxy-6-hydroxymethyldihydropteridine diphosphokinase